jgi:hypothetical protein
MSLILIILPASGSMPHRVHVDRCHRPEVSISAAPETWQAPDRPSLSVFPMSVGRAREYACRRLHVRVVVRRQPVMFVDGRAEGGYAGVFGLICCECGDNPYLDYAHVSPRLQQIRGPYAIAAGLAAYDQHLGLTA